MEASSEFHAPASLTPGRDHGTHLTRGWVDFLAGLKFLEKRQVFCTNRELNLPNCAAHSLVATPTALFTFASQ